VRIDKELCIDCGNCVIYCPVNAIVEEEGIIDIDFHECVECGNCLRMSNCPTDAIYRQEMEYPRIIRAVMSDPYVVAPNTGIPGRGTAEIKTNDVTGRFKRGFIGMAIELGRPITGVWISDVEKVAVAIAKHGIRFEEINPVTAMMVDPSTGKFKEELLNEKVLSAILEFAIEPEKVAGVLKTLEAVQDEVDCVFSVDIASRCNPDLSVPHEKIIQDAGYWISLNAKTNLGLGKPLAKED
jgi:NAD-dependent dihydropyrimidine dehydrogenase PreA subunit